MSINLINNLRRGGMTRDGPMHKMGLLGSIRPQEAGTTGENGIQLPMSKDMTRLGGSHHRRGAGFLSNLFAIPSSLIKGIGLGKARKGHLNPGLQAYLDKKRAAKGGAVPMPGGRIGGAMAGYPPMTGGRKGRRTKKGMPEEFKALMEKKMNAEMGGSVPMPGGKKRRGGFWGMLAASLLPSLLNKVIPDAQAGSKKRHKSGGRRHKRAGTAGIYYG